METRNTKELLEIKGTLNRFFALYKLINSEKIKEKKENILKSKTKRRIYELCDGQHTVTDITNELNLSQPNVSYHLSTLLESGLVSYVEEGGTRFYFKTLE